MTKPIQTQQELSVTIMHAKAHNPLQIARGLQMYADWLDCLMVRYVRPVRLAILKGLVTRQATITQHGSDDGTVTIVVRQQ